MNMDETMKFDVEKRANSKGKGDFKRKYIVH